MRKLDLKSETEVLNLSYAVATLTVSSLYTLGLTWNKISPASIYESVPMLIVRSIIVSVLFETCMNHEPVNKSFLRSWLMGHTGLDELKSLNI